MLRCLVESDVELRHQLAIESTVYYAVLRGRCKSLLSQLPDKYTCILKGSSGDDSGDNASSLVWERSSLLMFHPGLNVLR